MKLTFEKGSERVGENSAIELSQRPSGLEVRYEGGRIAPDQVGHDHCPIIHATTAFGVPVPASTLIAVASITRSSNKTSAKRFTDSSPVCLRRKFNCGSGVRERARGPRTSAGP